MSAGARRSRPTRARCSRRTPCSTARGRTHEPAARSRHRPGHHRLPRTAARRPRLGWGRSGRRVARAIVWQDRRTSERCAALRRAGVEPAIRRATGLVLDPYFSGTKLEWMLRHHRGLRARARRGTLAFGTVDSWLLWKLTAGRGDRADHTHASRTRLYDIRRRDWSDAPLQRF